MASSRRSAANRSGLAIVRAAHLIVASQVLREIGVPVERELRRAGLPGLIEELPNEYVAMHAALDWAIRCCRDIDIAELGFLAASRSSLATLCTPLRQAILDAPSGLARVRAFQRLAKEENCSLSVQPWREGDDVRVICNTDRCQGHRGLHASEWLQLQAIVSVVRSVAGAAWVPSEVTFVSDGLPTDSAQTAFPDTRFRYGQAHTSVLVPAALLSLPTRMDTTPAQARRGAERPPEPESPDFIRALRKLVRPYLAEGNPGIGQVAELVSSSKRTLQRTLATHRTTWSDLLSDARYELACELLAEPDYKIIDVALATGYEHPQHFARAFRQVAGVSPRAYRTGLAGTN